MNKAKAALEETGSIFRVERKNLSGGSVLAYKSGEVTAWYDERTGEMRSLWVRNGLRAIPVNAPVLDPRLRRRETFKELVAWLLKMGVAEGEASRVLGENYICSDCGRLDSIEGLGHSHFAGLYCPECAQAYRRQRSAPCLLCGQPEHSCCC